MCKFHFKNFVKQEMAEDEQQLLAKIARSWNEQGVGGTIDEVKTIVGVLTGTGILIAQLYLVLLLQTYLFVAIRSFPTHRMLAKG